MCNRFNFYKNPTNPPQKNSLKNKKSVSNMHMNEIKPSMFVSIITRQIIL